MLLQSHQDNPCPQFKYSGDTGSAPTHNLQTHSANRGKATRVVTDPSCPLTPLSSMRLSGNHPLYKIQEERAFLSASNFVSFF